jgi:hypothetical protein
MVAWWLMVSLPIMAAMLAPRKEAADQGADATPAPSPQPSQDGDDPTFAAAAYCSVLLGVLLLSLPWLESVSPIAFLRDTHRDEMDLEEVVCDLPAGDHRIFSRFEWGEYLGWRVAPHSRIFMDGRIEIYPDNVWADYLAVTTAGGGWQSILDRYDVDCLVLDNTYHENLIAEVRRSGQWCVVKEVGKAIVFERLIAHRTPATAPASVRPARPSFPSDPRNSQPDRG